MMGKDSGISSSWYRTFAAFSLLALLTIWPTLRGLTGLGVSQLVSAIFTIPTWTVDTQEEEGYYHHPTWSLPVQDLKMVREMPRLLPSMRTPSPHLKMYWLPIDWRRTGWWGWYTVPG